MRGSRSILAPGVIVSFLSALLLAPASASASVRTHWDTAPACVDATSLPSRVDALLDEPPASPVLLSLGADEADETWTISMRLEGLPVPQSRTLRGRDCSTLTEAVALVVAVQLDAVALAAAMPLHAAAPTVPPEPEDEPRSAEDGPSQVDPHQPADEPLPETSTSSRGTPSPQTGRGSRLRPVLGIALAGELGILPRSGGSLEPSAGLAWPRARLELGGLVSVGPPAAAETVPSVGARFVLLTTVVRGCGVLGRGRVELPLCGGLELGDLRARGTGLQRPRVVDTPWVATTAGARPQWRLRPALWLGGLIDLVVPLRRHRFGTLETGTIHLVPALAVRLGVRLQWRLP